MTRTLKRMPLNLLKIVLLIPLILFIVFYLLGAYMAMSDGRSVEPLKASPTSPIDIAIFGASGTAGDRILKAALASADIAMLTRHGRDSFSHHMIRHCGFD